MAAGYQVGTGADPYSPGDLGGVFGLPLFSHLTSVGYPPPWPLILGLAYRLSFALVHNLFLYNLAIKVPVIAANLCLALLARRAAQICGAGEAAAQRTLIFVLFSPLLLYTTAAWGQFDTVVALLSLLALYFLWRQRTVAAAAFLALAVSLKPIALPLVPLFVLYAGRSSLRRAVQLAFLSFAGLALFCLVPFAVFSWSLAPILNGWDAHFVTAGGLSLLTFWELIGGSYILPGPLQFLGYLWMAGLLLAFAFIRPAGRSFADLLQWALRIILVFFLTRAWLSEPNVDLALPIAAVLVAAGLLERRTLRALWIVPLVFTLFNASLPQLLFLVYPRAMDLLAGLDQHARGVRLIARAASVLPWLVVGWRTVLCRGVQRGRDTGTEPRPAERSAAGQPFLSLVLPTYNEVENIAPAIAEAEDALSRPGIGVEIIVVDDGSPDGTAAAARRVAERFDNVRVIDRGARRGLASAIRDGLCAARGEMLAVMDADLQHPPSALAALAGRLRDGCDLAILSRYLPASRIVGRGFARAAASRCAVFLTHLLLPRTRGIRDPIAGCFMMRRAVMSDIDPLGFKVLPQILARGSYSQVAELPYTFLRRRHGRSKMQPAEPLRYVRLLLRLRKGLRS